MAVLPEYQGQGIGRQLVDACVAEARELGIKTVFTLTMEPTFFSEVRISAGRTGYALNQGMAGVLPLSQILEVRRNRHDTHVAGVTAPVDTMPAREDSARLGCNDSQEFTAAIC